MAHVLRGQLHPWHRQPRVSSPGWAAPAESSQQRGLGEWCTERIALHRRALEEVLPIFLCAVKMKWSFNYLSAGKIIRSVCSGCTLKAVSYDMAGIGDFIERKETLQVWEFARIGYFWDMSALRSVWLLRNFLGLVNVLFLGLPHDSTSRWNLPFRRKLLSK